MTNPPAPGPAVAGETTDRGEATGTYLLANGDRLYGDLTVAYTAADVDEIEWLIRFARRTKGSARVVADRALAQNPDLRRSAMTDPAVPGSQPGTEALNTADLRLALTSLDECQHGWARVRTVEALRMLDTIDEARQAAAVERERCVIVVAQTMHDRCLDEWERKERARPGGQYTLHGVDAHHEAARAAIGEQP